MKNILSSVWRKVVYLFVGKKFTLIILPNSQNQVKNIKVGKFQVCFLLVVFFTLFSFSTITLGRYIYYSVREILYTQKHEKFASEVNNMLANSGKIMVAQEKFNNTLNGLLSDLGMKSAINLQVGVGGPLVNVEEGQKLSTSNNEIMKVPGLDKLAATVDEVDLLQDLSNNAQAVEKKIRLLTKKVKTFESIVRYIPSIWPLKGEGKIVDSKNGIMIVNTVPFTPVIATAEGKVAGVSFLDKGMKVTLMHKYQFISTYNGLFQVNPNIKKGMMVKKGDVLGYVAKTKGAAVLYYGLFVGNFKGIYALDPLGFSYMGR